MAKHELTDAEYQIVLAYRAMQEAKAKRDAAAKAVNDKAKARSAADEAYDRAADEFRKAAT